MPETLTLTNGKLEQLAAGLAALDGLRTKPDEFRPYRFDDQNETTWLIADNADALVDALKKYATRKKMLTVQHGVQEGMAVTEKNRDSVMAFLADLEKLDELEVAVTGLKKISRARLKVGKGEKENPIPPSVLARLMPLLEE